MSDNRPRRLVCGPADGGPRTSDSITATAACGHAVYIAGAGQRLLAEHPDAEVMCAPCALPEIMAMEERPEMVTPPGMLEDIDREFGEAERAQVERIAKMLGFQTHG